MGRFFRFLFLLALLAGALAWLDVRNQLDGPLPISAPTRVEIAPGQTLSGVLDQLASRGVIAGPRAALYLRLQARLSGASAAIKAGEYELAPGTSARSMLALFVSGKVMLHELRLVEGWTFSEAMKEVAGSADLKHTLSGDPAEAMRAIGAPGVHPEGRFLPETYRFPRQTTDVDFLKRAYAAMQTALEQEWAARDPAVNLAQPLDALVLASIVEKETGVAAERPQIAGVFLRRLARNMRLQTDPTVIYGMGERFDGNLRRVDLESDGPYNSYTREGLPPTPICLPGRAALHAALHPDGGQSLYFVARGDGSHQFSDTLEQHAAAVQKFQLRQP